MTPNVQFATRALMLIFALAFFSSATATCAQVVLSEPARGQCTPNTPVTTFTSGASALQIPLDIDNKIILVRVAVNDSPPLKFILDTGASISMISTKRAAELGLKSSARASGEATGGRINASIIEGVSLSVTGARVANQLLAAVDFPDSAGFEFDGIIGYHFINQFVMEIDYQKKLMNLYSPQSYRYVGKGEVVPLDLAGRKTPLVRTKVFAEGRAPVELRVELDTGSDGTLLVNSPAVKKHDLLSTMPQAVQQKARGAGGEQDRVLGPVKTLQLGNFVFDKAPIALSLDTRGGGSLTENDGALGGEILRRFKVILDYSRQRMILERNSSFNEPYDVEGEE